MTIPVAGSADLVVLVADRDTEAGIRQILARNEALRIRRIQCDIFVHPQRDPGCLVDGANFLRQFSTSYGRALIVFDREGCGRDDLPREEIEESVTRNLASNGWGDRCAAVVIDPELEAWIWTDSPRLPQVLGWQSELQPVISWLRENGFTTDEHGKPFRPKEAFESTLRAVRKPRSSRIYEDLARSISLERCSDEAFMKLKRLLASWFAQ